MAINNDLVPELQRVEEHVRSRTLWREVSDTLFGVLNGQEHPRVIIDSVTLGLLNTIENLSDYTTQRNNLDQNINGIMGIWWYARELDVLRNGEYTVAPSWNNLTVDNDALNTIDLNEWSWDGGLNTENEIHRQLLLEVNTRRALKMGGANRDLVIRVANILIERENNRHTRVIENINRRIHDIESNMARDQRELDQLNRLWWLFTEMERRNLEVTRMVNSMRNLRINTRIPDVNVNYAPLPGNPPAISITNLAYIFGNVWGITYDICENNNSWDPLPNAWWGRSVTLEWGQTITLRGLSINGTNLEANNVTINPVEWVNFPVHIELAIRGRVVDAATWVAMDHYKPFRFTLNAPDINMVQRNAIYNGIRGAIDNRISSEYTNPRRETIENEVIRAILRDHGNTAEVEAIENNAWSKNLLEERIRNIPHLIPAFTIPNLIAEFQAESVRNVPAQYLVSENAFRDYLRNNLEQKVRDFVSRRIRQEMETHHPEMVSTLLNFQADVNNQNIDNNDDNTIAWLAVLDQEAETHPENFWQRLTGRYSRKNNWTKFFTGRSAETINDSMEVDGTQYDYNITSAVQWVNKVTATININGEEPLILDARDLNQLVRLILNQEVTKEWNPLPWKIRCRMAVDAIKWFVSISPVTLSRELRWNVHTAAWANEPIDRITARIRNGNLEVIAARSNANRRRSNFTIFDESRYKSLHTLDHLRNWVIQLSSQVNDIMNAIGSEFNTATKNWTSMQLMRYGTSFPLQGGGIKKLWTKLRHGETNWNFDFTTAANAGWKNVQIRYQAWVFTLSGEADWQPYEISGKNLGKLLRHKKNRKRIFDGVELSIIERVNETMIERLRTNALIWPENFVVSDRRWNKTWRVFFLDSYWDLSYIDIEDAASFTVPNRWYDHINATDLPPARVRCNDRERADFMQNPLLSWRLLRAMRMRLSFAR